jgi:ABC-type bacteriocin/lantibiotic exporter with double-glycine peptidase domain
MRFPFQKKERLLEFSPCRGILSEILDDKILVQHCSEQVKDYYLDLVKSSSEIKAVELVVAINDLGIMLLENSQISTMYYQFTAYSRIALIDFVDDKAIYAAPGMKQFLSQEASTSKNARFYTLVPKLPHAKIFKWKIALQAFLPFWPKYLISLVFMVVFSIVAILPTIAIVPLFDTVVPDGDVYQLLIIGGVLVLTQPIGNYMSAVSTFFAEAFENDISFRIGVAALDRYFSAVPLSLPTRNVGGWNITFYAFSLFTNSIKIVIINIPLAFINIALNVFAFGIALNQPSTILLLLLLSAIPAIVNVLFDWRVGMLQFRQIAIRSRVQEHLFQSVTNVADIRALNDEANFESKFDDLRSDFNKFLLRSNAWSETGIFLNTFITAILTGAILFLYSSSDSISQGRYLLIFVAFSAVTQQFTSLAKSIASLLSSLPTYFSKNALRDLDQFNNYTTPGLHILSKGNSLSSIELIDVDFGYVPQQRIISGLSTVFKGGTKYCINGLSGSGKSTLLKIIAGHYNPNNGSILINNQPNSQSFSQLLKFNVCYIPQTKKLLGRTFLNFLDPYNKHEKDEIESFLEKVGLIDFVQQLPMQLSSHISEFTGDLSTGEIELFQIARALLSKPDLLLSDEPTSNLSEEDHLKYLDLLNKNCNLHITNLHRLSAQPLFDHSINLS